MRLKPVKLFVTACCAIALYAVSSAAQTLPGTSVSHGAKTGPNWVCVNEKAAWQPRDSQGEFVHNGQMWILGGWDTPKTPNFLDVWKSSDGRQWTRALETGPWGQTDLPVSLTFGGKMWIMGGRKVPGTECSNKVWSSSDGTNWTLVTPNAGWSPRLSPSFVVFKGRMWVLGGTTDFYQNNDQTLFNDVWSSSDGREWKLEQANAGWSKRAHAQAVVFNNKIWIMGGGSRAPKPIPTNDVWSSDDGVNWKQVTDGAPWVPRLWFSAVVYRDRMWVLGGWAESGNFGDVWYSKDGRSWTELKSDVIWTKRHEHSAFVFKDRIWVAGGAAEPRYALNSEVWSLEIPRAWFNGE
jgi:hypothetical protein